MGTVCSTCGADNPGEARFCLSCGTALARPRSGPEHEHEERKIATVLFADLVGSTALADDQDPERTRQFLNRFYDAMTDEVERHGGTIEKFAGDAVMAAFGAPAALEDHAERALHAAMAMHERLAELFGGRVALRIGVNTGEVIVGRAREGSSFVTGDVVNVAARLEQAAAPGETLAGEKTITASQGAFELGEPTEIAAKGKHGGVPAYRVLRALSLTRPRGLRGMPQVFVGREAELATLREHYATVQSTREPRLVPIFGEAGVGKTRLMRELVDWLATQSPRPIQRTGRVLSYGKGNTYWPMREVLREHFGMSEGDDTDLIASKLADRPDLGLTLGIAAAEPLHPLVARERLQDAWVEFLTELSAARPVVLLIEDAHWAEEQLWDLLDILVAQVSGPLLVLVTARTELLDRRPAWGGSWSRTSAMRLEALPPADTGRMLSELLGGEIPAHIRDIVVERAEGNPFFVEELIATFVDHGVLERRDGTWTFGELPAGFTVPDSVRAVLAARIDLLPHAEKQALQAAAVIGRRFWTGPMYELVGDERPDIGILEDREFVRRRPTSSMPGEREYQIKHALTREVAYGSLPRARRARLHADFAGWLEGRTDGRDELASLLAHHYFAAVRPEDVDLVWADRPDELAELRTRAIAWLRKAADLAVGRYEIEDGITLLKRAIELEPDAVRQAELWYAVGHASALRYDGEGLVSAMERALELGADPGAVYAELAFQRSLRAGMWKRRLDDDVAAGWIERAISGTDEHAPAHGRALVAKGMHFHDADAARAALDLAEQLDDVVLKVDALSALEAILADDGALREALDASARLHELLPQVADPDRVADTLFTDAGLHMAIGNFAQATANAMRVQDTVAGLTPHHRVHGMALRAMLDQAAADWEAIRRVGDRAEEAIERNLATPCPYNVGILTQLGCALTVAGNDAEAARVLRRADEIGMAGYSQMLASCSLSLAIARGDAAEMRRLVDAVDPGWLVVGDVLLWAALLDALVALDDRTRIEAEAPRWLDVDSSVTAFAMRSLAVVRDDEQLLEAAAARFEGMGLPLRAAETRAWQGRLSG